MSQQDNDTKFIRGKLWEIKDIKPGVTVSASLASTFSLLRTIRTRLCRRKLLIPRLTEGRLIAIAGALPLITDCCMLVWLVRMGCTPLAKL